MLAGLLDGLFNGISIGAVLLISALGLAIVFGLMGVINLAHGELMMLGAYTTYIVQNVFKPLGSPWFDLYIFVALIMAFLVVRCCGVNFRAGSNSLSLWTSIRNPAGNLGSELDFAAVRA